ncbi:succinate dehydrogenase cytochrome b560 subunit, mitochondrial-like [Belonocnema kinseyi]|uniref:succinate dehydrogenase cytochrome b560 subunit, mitochondrial-like n=1 Tax=Belonocnema kinseyi TaxID=2817044 RepID=UPI00143DC3DF|nr:succinate dehydrogenase cytochrome b560 subunit, mitochondrial-like [Belonocnema kinseyi]
MALSFTRLLCRKNLDFRQFRGLYTSSSLTASTSSVVRVTAKAIESHDEKNMRLNRPMSPHLTIYQLQLTSALSLSHRTTGIILATYAISLSFGTLLIPGGIPCFIDSVENLCLPPAVLFIGKTLLALPFTFHYANGLRHLAWDLGKFLTLKEVYTTGYVISAVSAIAALIVAAL